MTNDPLDHSSYVDRVRQDTLQYTRDLLSENERIRTLLVKVEKDSSELRRRLARAHQELAERTEQETRLQTQLASVEEESRRFSERYAQVEQENSNLANLYVTSYRLHGTVERRDVLEILQEILANLIGSEEIAIFEVDAGNGHLELVASVGIEAAPFQKVAIGHGLIGQTAELGETWIGADDAAAERRSEEANLTACIPLRLNGKVTGAIALFRLLPQKTRGIEALDRELFDLLATHAAVALYCSGLHARLTEAVSPARSDVG